MQQKDSTITILTPAYNRANLLKRLYDSLKRQTNLDFKWLIVDDCSTDNTEQVVNEFCAEKLISIQYMKRNVCGGKHRALNMGMKEITSELTFIVDSDDYLPVDAVEIILKYHEKYKRTDNLCGYSFLRFFEDGSVNTAYFKKDEEISSYRDVRINGNIGGDKAEVFYTQILKKFPFSEYEGEKYLPEDAVWMKMSGPYQMVHINKCIYIGEYLEGGLTRTGHAMKIHSPRGMMERSEIYLSDDKVCMKVKIKMMILYIVYGKFAEIPAKQLYKKIASKSLFRLLYLPSELVYYKWERESRGMDS